MIVSQLQLKRRVFGIFGVREAGNDLTQRLQSQPGVFLILFNAGNLLVITERFQIIGIGNVLVAGVKFDEAVQTENGVVIFLVLVIGISAHDFGLGRPFGIGMLQLDLFEGFGRLFISGSIQIVMRLIVKFFGSFGLFNLFGRGTGRRQPQTKYADQKQFELCHFSFLY